MWRPQASPGYFLEILSVATRWSMQWVSSFRLVIFSMEWDKTSYWCHTINCCDFLVHEGQQPEIAIALTGESVWRCMISRWNYDNTIKRDYSHPKIYLIFRSTLYSQRLIYLGQAVLKGTFTALDEIYLTVFLYMYWKITYWLFI